MELGLRELRERAEPTSATSLPLAKSRMSARVYSRLTVACVPSTVTRLLTEPAQAGLIAGTVPTKGTEKRARKCGSTRVEAVLQAMTTRSGRWVSISSPMSAHDARDQLGLAAAAIGKEGVVGDVDVARVGSRLGDLAKDREAAKPGIEDENGRSGHGAVGTKRRRAAMPQRRPWERDTAGQPVVDPARQW